MNGVPARLAGALRKPRNRLLVGTMVGVGLLALVISKISLERVGQALTHLSWGLFAVGALAACGYVTMRAWRYRTLLGRGSIWAVLGVTAASWGAGQLLPGPGSDAAFVVLSRTDLRSSLSRGTGSALISRLLDVASLALILLISADLAEVRLPTSVRLASIGLAAVLFFSLAAVFVKPSRRWLLSRVGRIRHCQQFAVRAEAALDELTGWRTVVALIAATVGARLMAAVEYLCLFWALGADLSLWQVWLALAVRTLLFALPIQGVGGLGTSQVWWAGGLALAGLPISGVLALGLEVQILDLMVALPAGAAGWLALKLRRFLTDAVSPVTPTPREPCSTLVPGPTVATPQVGVAPGAVPLTIGDLLGAVEGRLRA